MKNLSTRLITFVCFALSASAAFAAGVAEHVVVVSIDGGKPSVMKESRMPHLMGLAARGAVSWEAQTVFPSITLPSHTSMLTSVSPRVHGINWNDWKPERGVVRVPTAFTAIRRHGLRTAAYVGKTKLRHLDVPGSIDRFEVVEGSARDIAQEAATYFTKVRPNFLFVHLPDADSVGHRKGWGSKAQKEALAVVDDAIKILSESLERAGVAAQTLLIVSADHGGLGLTHGSNAAHDMTIPWIASGAGVRAGVNLPRGIRTQDTTATAVWALGVDAIPGAEGRVVTQAFAN